MDSYDFQLNKFELGLMRQKIQNPAMQPFVVFCGPIALKQILEGGPIKEEDVVKNSRHIRGNLWAYVIAHRYDENTMNEIRHPKTRPHRVAQRVAASMKKQNPDLVQIAGWNPTMKGPSNEPQA